MVVVFVAKTRISILTLLTVCLLATGVRADEEPAARLLTSGWQKSNQARDDSELLFRSASDTDDAELVWAYVLNRLRHHRYRDAAEFGSQLLRLDPENPDAWYTKAWLEISQREVNRALVTVSNFQSVLKSIEALDDPEDDDRLLRSYQRLGRLIGFIESSHPGNFSKNTFDDAVDKIRGGTKKDFVVEFDRSRAQSINAYQTLEKRLATQEKIYIDQARLERAIEIDGLRDEIANTDTEVDDIRKDIDQARKDGQQRLDNIGQSIGQIQSDGNRVSADIYSTRRELGSLYGSLAFGDYALLNETDPFIRSLLIRQLGQTSYIARDREFALNSLYWGARNLYAQLSSARWDLQQTSNAVENRIANLHQEKSWLRRSQRAANRKIGKLQKPPVPRGASVAVLKSKMKSLKHFDPYPLELFRDEILKAASK